MPEATSTNQLSPRRKRIVVGITGATGAILGIKLLLVLRRLNIETHLVLSHWAEATIRYETDYTPANVKALADYVNSNRDQAAPISRAADVMLKERRRLVLAVRETPLSEIHLRNMLEVTRADAIICPAMPAFYMKPEGIDDLVDQMVGWMLDLFEVDSGDFQRWNGMEKE
jgi:4-hydroxy-3-polyprenylbenzoate decarboxylase